MPLELSVRQGERVIPDGLRTRQIPVRRGWRTILNGSSMDEIKDNDVVEGFHNKRLK